MYARSNMFANIESFYKNASEEEITGRILECIGEIANSDFENETQIGLLFIGAGFGLGFPSVLSDEQKSILDRTIGVVLNADNETIYSMTMNADRESTTQLLDNIAQLESPISLTILKYILGFAYANGGLSDEDAEYLDGEFGMSMLTDFIASGQEELPAPTVRLSGLEGEVAKYFDDNDPWLDLDGVCEQFSDADRSEIEKMLESLCEKEILYKAKTAIGDMYARLT